MAIKIKLCWGKQLIYNLHYQVHLFSTQAKVQVSYQRQRNCNSQNGRDFIRAAAASA